MEVREIQERRSSIYMTDLDFFKLLGFFILESNSGEGFLGEAVKRSTNRNFTLLEESKLHSHVLYTHTLNSTLAAAFSKKRK